MNTTEYTNTEKICNIQTNNKLNYTTALGSIKKKKYQIIFNNDAMSKQSDLIYLPLEQKEIESESYLTKEEVNCIKSYIEYYGLNKWLNLSSEKREYLINNVIKVMCEGDLCYPINADLGYLLFDEIISRVTSNRSSKYNVHGIKLDYYQMH